MTDLSDADIAARIRHGQRCPLCRGDRRPGGMLCWEDHDELGRMLDPDYLGDRDLERAASISVLYQRLDPAPAATGLADRRVPGFTSEPPCNLHVVAMRDPRSVAYPVVAVWYEPLHSDTNADDLDNPHYEDDAAPRAVGKAIASLADAVWDDLDYGRWWAHLGYPGPAPARTVEQHCRWLHAHLDQLTARDDAAEIHRDIVELHDQLRPAAGDPRPQPVADCTGWTRDPHTREKIECGAPLYLPPPQPGVESGPARPVKIDPKKPVIRCPRCDRPYTHLMLLRQEIGAQRKAS